MESFFVIKSSAGMFYNPDRKDRSSSMWSHCPAIWMTQGGAEAELKNLQKFQPEFANAISIQEYRLVK